MAVDAPVAATLDYAWAGEPTPHGTWVCVPLGRRKVLGLAISAKELSKDGSLGSGQAEIAVAPEKIRSVDGLVSAMPPADAAWIRLAAFAARYYRRPFGTVAVGLAPKWLRDLKNHAAKTTKTGKHIQSNCDRLMAEVSAGSTSSTPSDQDIKPGVSMAFDSDLDRQHVGWNEPTLNTDQASALDAIRIPGVHVLHGVTGSGKTRVYTEAVKHFLAQHPNGQALVMVPEIGLTPQLVERFRKALPGIGMAVLHSEVSERERARLWMMAATQRARLVIGTRLAVMTPMPMLGLIIIDEEHDHSYKQQEGMRYNARDLAVWRAQDVGASLVLGSATPSIETWAQIERGRYARLTLPHRATGEPAAPIRLIDTLKDPAKEGLSAESRKAIADVLASGGQVLVFLNRRGYAPVLSCASCAWTSNCTACGIATVLHKTDGWRLQCHHCGLVTSVPRACPECGDTDLQPVGRGVQRLEQTLMQEFPSARVLRIDRDTVKQGKALAAEIDRIQRGEVEIVVGTQMLAKGHDFARMRLVIVVDADTQLVNPDFRAPERLFATLMQVAGRAGRHAHNGSETSQTDRAAQVLIQTRYPQHRLYHYLLRQDVEGFAKAEMEDRKAAGLPPFAHMAAIRASHADPRKAQSGLRQLRDELQELAKENHWPVTVYGPVARYPEMQGGRWRGQLMIESANRNALHALLAYVEEWMTSSRLLDPHLDVDPYEV